MHISFVSVPCIPFIFSPNECVIMETLFAGKRSMLPLKKKWGQEILLCLTTVAIIERPWEEVGDGSLGRGGVSRGRSLESLPVPPQLTLLHLLWPHFPSLYPLSSSLPFILIHSIACVSFSAISDSLQPYGL